MANFIKACLKKVGKRQQDVAEVVGVSPEYLSGVARGKIYLTIEHVLDLARELGISVRVLYTLVSAKTEPRRYPKNSLRSYEGDERAELLFDILQYLQTPPALSVEVCKVYTNKEVLRAYGEEKFWILLQTLKKESGINEKKLKNEVRKMIEAFAKGDPAKKERLAMLVYPIVGRVYLKEKMVA